MNTLIQAITDYTAALEQKLSALEARADGLQGTVDNLQLTVDNLQGTVEKLQAENEALRAVGAGLPTTDPEVEIELIVEGEGVSDLSDSSDASDLSDRYVETPLELLEKLEVAELESGVELPIVEPVVEPAPETIVAPEPAPQPVPEVKVEPVIEVKVEKPAPQPAQRPMPQQTSLFAAGVEDIRQAISLGDRFLFQRELFAGNGELMQKTLDEINSLGSLSEAMDYVLDNFEWDKESTAVQLFENVLKRRFG